MTEERTKHPSYALISFSRINGSQGTLFGSSLDSHQHSIEMRVATAEQIVDEGGHVSYYGSNRGDVVELRMSAAQFAELITTLGGGIGVPCTLTRRGSEYIERPKAQQAAGRDIREARKVFARRLDKVRRRIDQLVKDTAAVMQKPKMLIADKTAITDALSSIQMEVNSNADFWLECFAEAVDKMVVHAKAEVDGFITTAAHQAGLKALALMAPAQETEDNLVDNALLVAGNPYG